MKLAMSEMSSCDRATSSAVGFRCRLNEFFETVDRNQPPVGAVMNDFLDALAAAGNCRFATSHGLEINTSQPFETAGQNKNRTVPHSFRNCGAAQSPLKMDLTADAQIFGQSGKAIPISAFTNHSDLQAGMRILYSGKGPQHQLMSFPRQQSPNNQDGWSFVLCRTRSKEVRIRAVVDNFSRNREAHALGQQPPYFFADADHLVRVFIDAQRSFTAPSRRHAVLKTTVEDVQTVNGNNKWNVQALRKKCSSVAAGQRRMSVYHVYAQSLMEFPYFSQNNPAQKLSRARESKIARKLRIANPFGRRLDARLPSGVINRIHRDNRGHHALELKVAQAFSHKATLHFVPF